MVANLVRLKWALVRAMFRRSRAQTIGIIVGVLYFGLLVALGMGGLVAARSDPAQARVYVPLIFAAIMLAWVIVPLFAFGTDPTLDARRFALYPIPVGELAVGLVVAGCIGLPAIATGLIFLASVVTWSQGILATLVALVSAVVALLTCVALSRWLTALATSGLASRRGRDLMAVGGFVLLMLVWVGVQVAPAALNGAAAKLATISSVIGWTPVGWVFSAPADVAVGLVTTGLVKLILAVGLLVVIFRAWAHSLRREVENPHQVRDVGRTHAAGDLGWFARLPDSPAGAVGARMATYWQRDPRYQIGMLASPIAPLAMLVPWRMSGIEILPLLLAPALAFLLGWSEHNSVSYEDTAFWLHLATGVDGRADRLGRLVPNAAICAVLIPVYSVLGTWLVGRFDLLPAVFGAALGVLGAGYAVSSVMSVLMAYPVAKPGESPFASPPGAVGATLLGQLVCTVAVAVLALPVLGLGWLAWSGQGWAVWTLLVVGPAWGACVLWLGVRYGATLFQRRGPALLAEFAKA